ncbi:class I SAM-dependent methyltransferase [Amycolatopsis thermoflava]|uniref:Methyltransferase family protein n=1 Tax=Amycolatopsis thermoflava TaxID=84480 RepID=A0A3N2H1G1_9PSEU|nr:class I SAM-dependent methyltransferase [Amycolatopsis thermoflava]ROS42763.1 methyltransferase family protein [Amycolatopsis thermoflava]
MTEAFFALFHGLPRQGPGSDATTLRLLDLARPLPERPRVLDLGCGPGRSALLLAKAGARVTGLDTHQPFLDDLAKAAEGLDVDTVNASMADPPFPDGEFDLLWAESSVFVLGFDTALRTWKRLLKPGGALVLTECEWSTGTPSAAARQFWDEQYPLRTTEENSAAAVAAGYRVEAVFPQPDSDWFDEFYDHLAARADAAAGDPAMAEAVAAARREIAMRREHGSEYQYTGYVLRTYQ